MQKVRKLCYEEKNSATTGRDGHEKFQLWCSYVLGRPPFPQFGQCPIERVFFHGIPSQTKAAKGDVLLNS